MGFWKKLKKRLKPPKKLRKAFKKVAGKALKGIIGGIPIIGGLAKEIVNVDKLFGKAKRKVQKALDDGINIKANINNLDVGLKGGVSVKGLDGISGKIKKLTPILIAIGGVVLLMTLLKRK